MFKGARALGSAERGVEKGRRGEGRRGRERKGRGGEERGRHSREKQILNKLESHIEEAGFKIHFILELKLKGSHLLIKPFTLLSMENGFAPGIPYQESDELGDPG